MPDDLPQSTPRTIRIANAGLVLTSAYLPHLFGRLDFVGPDADGHDAWRDSASRDRAVRLLQWLVDERWDVPDREFPLNKLLCGIDPSGPISSSTGPTEAEIALGLSLLRAMLAATPALASSSPPALRETFLQRDGTLTYGDTGWQLDVERKTVDVILAQVPWQFSRIRHPWMPDLLAVDWC